MEKRAIPKALGIKAVATEDYYPNFNSMVIIRGLPYDTELSAHTALNDIVQQLATKHNDLAPVTVRSIDQKALRMSANIDYGMIRLREPSPVDELASEPERMIKWMKALREDGKDCGWVGNPSQDIARRAVYDLTPLWEQFSDRPNGYLADEIKEAMFTLKEKGHEVHQYTQPFGGNLKLLHVMFRDARSITASPPLVITLRSIPYIISMRPCNMHEPVHPFEFVFAQSAGTDVTEVASTLVKFMAQFFHNPGPNTRLTTSYEVSMDDIVSRGSIDLENSHVQHVRVIDHHSKAIIVLMRSYESSVMLAREIREPDRFASSFNQMHPGLRFVLRGSDIYQHNNTPYTPNDRGAKELRNLSVTAGAAHGQTIARMQALERRVEEQNGLAQVVIEQSQSIKQITGVMGAVAVSSLHAAQQTTLMFKNNLNLDGISYDISQLNNQIQRKEIRLYNPRPTDDIDKMEADIKSLQKQVMDLEKQRIQARLSMATAMEDQSRSIDSSLQTVTQFLIDTPQAGTGSTARMIMNNARDTSEAHISETSIALSPNNNRADVTRNSSPEKSPSKSPSKSHQAKKQPQQPQGNPAVVKCSPESQESSSAVVKCPPESQESSSSQEPQEIAPDPFHQEFNDDDNLHQPLEPAAKSTLNLSHTDHNTTPDSSLTLDSSLTQSPSLTQPVAHSENPVLDEPFAQTSNPTAKSSSCVQPSSRPGPEVEVEPESMMISTPPDTKPGRNRRQGNSIKIALPGTVLLDRKTRSATTGNSNASTSQPSKPHSTEQTGVLKRAGSPMVSDKNKINKIVGKSMGT